MRPALLLLLFLTGKMITLAQSAPPIGGWREHLPYHQVISAVQAGDQVWAATPYSLFSVDPSDNSVERFSKISGLTAADIRCFGKDAGGEKLVVVYQTGNIDIISGGTVKNIPDIVASAHIGDKRINQVYSASGRTWLAGNEAIYLVNTDKYEIQDTYIIGPGGSKVTTNALVLFNGSLYAATNTGILSATLNGPNLSDFRNWKRDTSFPVTGTPVTNIATVSNKLICSTTDSLFISNGNSWSLLFADGWQIHTVQSAGNKLLVNERLNSNGRVIVLNADGTIDRTLANPSIRAPRQTLLYNGDYWVADSLGGLIVITTTGINSIVPASPATISLGATRSEYGKVVTASGGVTDNWEPMTLPGSISLLQGNEWKNFDERTITQLQNFSDILPVTIDPVDQSIWAGSYGDGLINIKNDGPVQLFKQGSFIKETYFTPGSYRVAGLRFDEANNLWISNYGADENIIVRKSDGSTKSFRAPFPLIDNAVGDIIIDVLDQKWIVSPKSNGLICFNHGESVDNAGDDQWKWFRTGAGNGNLPDNNVLSIAADKDGFIWVGTAKGIAVIRCIEDVFAPGGCEAIRPVVQQDNFAGYLFSNESVQAIAVDGANRKWVGTKNGLWLLSADGGQIIYRFSADNSPLPSDDVKQIAIDRTNGEVFIATSAGIMSFRSTATEATESSKNVLVFPNPVPPGYTGTIAIRGLIENSIVKITELNGNLVYQTRALGGQAIWNGKDYKGRQISTGVYLVLISDETKKEQVATKIVYIKK
jgi:ligand-binding sensor domain-containing protein